MAISSGCDASSNHSAIGSDNTNWRTVTDVIVLGGGLSPLPHLYESVPQIWGQ